MPRCQCPRCFSPIDAETLTDSIGTCPRCGSRFRVPAGIRKTTTPPRPAEDPLLLNKPGRPASRAERPRSSPPPRRPAKRPDPIASPVPERPRPAPTVSRRRPTELDEDLSPDVVEDEDDDDEEEEDDEPRPVRRRRRRRRWLPRAGLLGFTARLAAVCVPLWVVCFLLCFVHGLGAYLLLGAGFLLMLAGGLWFTALTFQDGLLTALLCYFVPLYALYFLVANWDRTGPTFVLQTFGFGYFLSGSVLYAVVRLVPA